MAGHKDNHAGMMTPAQMEAFQAAMGVRPEHEWTSSKAWRRKPTRCKPSSTRCRSPPRRTAALKPRPSIDVPAEIPITIQPTMATQTGFGAILNEIGRGDSEFARRIVTTVAGRDGVDQSRTAG